MPPKIRRVRTAAGVAKYNAPIGTIITDEMERLSEVNRGGKRWKAGSRVTWTGRDGQPHHGTVQKAPSSRTANRYHVMGDNGRLITMPPNEVHDEFHGPSEPPSIDNGDRGLRIEKTDSGKFWQITHAASGLRVSPSPGYKTKREASSVVEKLHGTGMNWEADRSTLMNGLRSGRMSERMRTIIHGDDDPYPDDELPYEHRVPPKNIDEAIASDDQGLLKDKPKSKRRRLNGKPMTIQAGVLGEGVVAASLGIRRARVIDNRNGTYTVKPNKNDNHQGTYRLTRNADKMFYAEPTDAPDARSTAESQFIANAPHKVGDRVSTEYGGATITAVSSRSTSLRLDNTGELLNIQRGTPGHGRIKPIMHRHMTREELSALPDDPDATQELRARGAPSDPSLTPIQGADRRDAEFENALRHKHSIGDKVWIDYEGTAYEAVVIDQFDDDGTYNVRFDDGTEENIDPDTQIVNWDDYDDEPEPEPEPAKSKTKGNTKLSKMSPKDIDTQQAAYYKEMGDLQNKMRFDLFAIHRLAGDEQQPDPYRRGQKRWQMSDQEAVDKLQMYLDTDSVLARYEVSDARENLARLERRQNDYLSIKKKYKEGESEHQRRGWSRFYLAVTSGGGHIHSSMNCPTCNNGQYDTQFGWLPEESGKSEKTAVEKHGPILCTVCYPSAPVEWTVGKDPLEGFCPGSGQRAEGYNPRRVRKYATCPSCGKYISVTGTGLLRKHKAEEKSVAEFIERYEQKDVIRHVRTAAGADRYGVPIGSRIRVHNGRVELVGEDGKVTDKPKPRKAAKKAGSPVKKVARKSPAKKVAKKAPPSRASLRAAGSVNIILGDRDPGISRARIEQAKPGSSVSLRGTKYMKKKDGYWHDGEGNKISDAYVAHRLRLSANTRKKAPAKKVAPKKTVAKKVPAKKAPAPLSENERGAAASDRLRAQQRQQASERAQRQRDEAEARRKQREKDRADSERQAARQRREDELAENRRVQREERERVMTQARAIVEANPGMSEPRARTLNSINDDGTTRVQGDANRKRAEKLTEQGYLQDHGNGQFSLTDKGRQALGRGGNSDPDPSPDVTPNPENDGATHRSTLPTEQQSILNRFGSQDDRGYRDDGSFVVFGDDQQHAEAMVRAGLLEEFRNDDTGNVELGRFRLTDKGRVEKDRLSEESTHTPDAPDAPDDHEPSAVPPESSPEPSIPLPQRNEPPLSLQDFLNRYGNGQNTPPQRSRFRRYMDWRRRFLDSLSKIDEMDLELKVFIGNDVERKGQHDLIWYSNRNSPKVVPRGKLAKDAAPKKGYGKVVRRRRCNAEEERTIREGGWVRVDRHDRRPGQSGYRGGSNYRPQLRNPSKKRK